MSTIIKIVEKARNILDIDQYFLAKGLVRSIRVKIIFLLGKHFYCVRIPITDKFFVQKMVWINKRYERLPQFYYHCGLLMHDTKMCGC